jgi:anti-sigma factor RsiW
VSCNETQSLLHAYVDGELDLVRTMAIEQHLRTCPTCAQAYQAQQGLRTALRGGALYYAPPAGMEKRLQTALRKADAAESGPRVLPWRALSLVASLAAVLILGWSLVRGGATPSADDLLAQQVLTGHLRSLMAPQQVDVLSSDKHTVKPWFDGKLDFSPPVADLATQGFPLIGGRLDYLDDRPVAALVYQRQKHIINLFVWPAPTGPTGSPVTTTRQGYNLVHWTGAGMTFWAISDLNTTELGQFVQLVETEAAPAQTP